MKVFHDTEDPYDMGHILCEPSYTHPWAWGQYTIQKCLPCHSTMQAATQKHAFMRVSGPRKMRRPGGMTRMC